MQLHWPSISEILGAFAIFAAFIFAMFLVVLVSDRWAIWSPAIRQFVRHSVRRYRFVREHFPPLVFIWKHGDLYGLLLSGDFERARRIYWRKPRVPKKLQSGFLGFPGSWQGMAGMICPDASEVLLFSDKIQPSERNYVIGSTQDMLRILEGCRVERRFFILPLENSFWNESRQRRLSTEEAAAHIHGAYPF